MDESTRSVGERQPVQRRTKRYSLDDVDSARVELLDGIYAGDRKTTKASIRELFPYVVVSRKHGMSWEKLAGMMSSKGLPVTPQTLAKYYTEFRADRELPHVKRLIKQIERNKERFDILHSLRGPQAAATERAEEALRKAIAAPSEASGEAPAPALTKSPPKADAALPQEALLPKLLADAVTLEKRGKRIPDVTCGLILRGKYVHYAETGEPFLGPLPSHQARILGEVGKLT